jgi:propanol-preferring alcohol dehydrogenase
LREPGVGPEVVDVAEPEPGPAGILIAVEAAGLCKSDLVLFDMAPALLRRRFPLPMTIGHEIVGTVVRAGTGPAAPAVGDRVAVYGPRGCGVCVACRHDRENYCPHAARAGIRPPGLGAPGGMTPLMAVESAEQLVPIGDLAPERAAPMTDAGAAAYHAVARTAPRLVDGTTAVVLGAGGGLGHLAVQVLRAITQARVLAVDVSEDKLTLAASVGAHDGLLFEPTAYRRVRELAGSAGADLVVDFVGALATVELAGRCVAPGGDVVLAAVGDATLPVGFAVPTHGVTVRGSYWGSRGDLAAVLDLVRRGQVAAEVETFPLESAPEAYRRLRAGAIGGRAVVLPGV